MLSRKKIYWICYWLCVNVCSVIHTYAQSAAERRSYGSGRKLVWFTLHQLDRYAFVRQPAIYPIGINQFDELFRLLSNKDPLPGQAYEIQPKTPVNMGVFVSQRDGDGWGGEIRSYSQTFSAYSAEDTSAATFFAMGISTDNYRDYKYHVVLNDSIELQPWQPVQLEQKHNAPRPYANLGTYHYPGQQMLVEVVNTKNYAARDGIIVSWQPIYVPVVTQITLSKDYEYFNLQYKPKSEAYVSRFDSITHLPLDLRFPMDSIEHLTIELQKHETQPLYVAVVAENTGKKDTTVLDWWMEENSFYVDRKYFPDPGHYEIIFCRRGYNDEPAKYGQYIFHLPFDVYRPAALDKTITIRQLLPYILSGIALVGVLFGWYFIRSRRRLKKEAYQRELKQVQLQSVRSQLNPHFLFNALSSIQSLVHKNDVMTASDYLARFAGITRTILNASEDELVSLDDELTMLDNYLQMEQLRFSFQYTLVAEAVNTANTEIPAMLLQPFAENAVKHGVAGMEGAGEIVIEVKAVNNHLVMLVGDNGKGFSVTADRSGIGLKLSERRIQLLNEMYGDDVVQLTIDSSATGTVVTITLKNWLS